MANRRWSLLRRVAVEHSVTDDAARNRTGQGRLQRHTFQVWCAVGPFLVSPFRRHDVVGEILKGKHGRGRIVDDDETVRANATTGPFHQIQQFVHVPVPQCGTRSGLG